MKYRFEANAQEKISDIISKNIAGISLPAIKALLKQGEIRLNGQKQKTDIIAKTGDEITVFVPQKYQNDAKVEVVYFDENIIIASKPPEMDVENNLARILQNEFDFIKPAHRLDRNTRGLVVFARNSVAFDELLRAFKNRLIEKYYFALVLGKFSFCGSFEAYLKKDADAGFVLISDEPKQGYVKIVSEFKPLAQNEDTTLVEVKLITGKTHQIRAHLAHLNHPIAGDDKYGGSDKRYKHQQLTAYKIIFKGLKPPLEYLSGKEFRIE